MTHAILILSLLIPGGQVETPHAWGKSDTFRIKSESVVYCAATDSYEFEIRFTEAPDFFGHLDTPGAWRRHGFRYLLSNREAIGCGVVKISGVGWDGNVYVSTMRGCSIYGRPIYIEPIMQNKTVRFTVPADDIGLGGEVYTKANTDTYGVTTPYVLGKSTRVKNCGHGPKAAPAQVTTWGHIKSAYR